jgi:N-acetylglucosamine-6-phosphate deacetylase
MKCVGRSAVSGERIEIEFDAAIKNVDPLLGVERDDGVFLAPGFIDLQVNGFAGVDFNSPTTSHDDIQRSILAIFSTGVTRFFPTVITAAPDAMLAALRNLATARESLAARDSFADGSAMEAFHVEGPHISPQDGPRGAHPKEWVRPPDFAEFLRWQDAAQGHVRLVTLSPEWPGAPRYIEQITELGVVAAIGHTRATHEQLRDAVAAGATLSTHLGNGAGSTTRTDDFIEYQLAEPRLAASFIVDYHHLPDEFLRRALEAKGVERSILVTDAVAPALCPPGPYMLGSVAVELRGDDRVTLRGGERLAGSSLRMDRAIGNVMARAEVGLAHAVTMATTNPARVGRVPGRLRGLQPGSRADLVRFRMDHGRVEVLETWLSGKRVYSQ